MARPVDDVGAKAAPDDDDEPSSALLHSAMSQPFDEVPADVAAAAADGADEHDGWTLLYRWFNEAPPCGPEIDSQMFVALPPPDSERRNTHLTLVFGPVQSGKTRLINDVFTTHHFFAGSVMGSTHVIAQSAPRMGTVGADAAEQRMFVAFDTPGLNAAPSSPQRDAAAWIRSFCRYGSEGGVSLDLLLFVMPRGRLDKSAIAHARSVMDQYPGAPSLCVVTFCDGVDGHEWVANNREPLQCLGLTFDRMLPMGKSPAHSRDKCAADIRRAIRELAAQFDAPTKYVGDATLQAIAPAAGASAAPAASRFTGAVQSVGSLLYAGFHRLMGARKRQNQPE